MAASIGDRSHATHMPPRRAAPPNRGPPVVHIECPSTAPAAAKPTREEKKAGKRGKQLAAMEAKAAAEEDDDSYVMPTPSFKAPTPALNLQPQSPVSPL